MKYLPSPSARPDSFSLASPVNGSGRIIIFSALAASFSSASEEDVAYAKNYLSLSDDLKNCHWSVMKALWATVAGVTIVQAQDLLGLGSESRMNTPSVLGGNWDFRVPVGAFDDKLAEKINECMKMYQRIS